MFSIFGNSAAEDMISPQIGSGGEMTRKFAFAVLILALCAFACKKSEIAPAPTTATAATNTATSAPPPPTTQSAATTAAAPAAAPAGVIASTEGEKPGVKIDVTELKRSSGGTVNLKFVLTNGSDKKVNIWGHWLGDGSVNSDYQAVGGIHLVDPVNKKKYFVVRDAEQKCMCSREVADVEPGGRVALWAKFPAPPPDVQKITIEIPHFTPIDDAPISQ
jgi:hypothetical protein